jgi:2-aminoadipate transaminase
MRPAAVAAGVAYVPGLPFHVGDNGRNALRLSFSHLSETELETAAERLAAVLRGTLEHANAGSRVGRR